MRRVLAVFMAAMVGIVAALVVARPAMAADCSWPYVCFWDDYYGGGPITAKFKAFTSYYQSITGTTQDSYYVQNTRNDDVAYIRFQSGLVYCLNPGEMAWLGRLSAGSLINGIMINDNPSTCA